MRAKYLVFEMDNHEHLRKAQTGKLQENQELPKSA